MAGHPRATLLAAFAVVSVALGGVLLVDDSSATSHDETTTTLTVTTPPPAAPVRPRPPQGARTVLDEDDPTVANLDAALLAALRLAATDAARDGVTIRVTSGWRSAAHQAELFRAAIAEYGSVEEAARWVATPQTSAHVSGDAVDIGPVGASAWLAEHGARYGLCQIYRNEAWHFELRPNAFAHGCQRPYDDPTHDPRMQ